MSGIVPHYLPFNLLIDNIGMSFKWLGHKPLDLVIWIRVPAFQFLRVGKCSFGPHKPEALGALPRPAI